MYTPGNRSFDPYKRVKKVAKLLGLVFLYRLYEWWVAPEAASQKALENVTTVAVNGSALIAASGLVIYGMDKLANYLIDSNEQHNQHLHVPAVAVFHYQNARNQNTVHPDSTHVANLKKLR